MLTVGPMAQCHTQQKLMEKEGGPGVRTRVSLGVDRGLDQLGWVGSLDTAKYACIHGYHPHNMTY